MASRPWSSAHHQEAHSSFGCRCGVRGDAAFRNMTGLLSQRPIRHLFPNEHDANDIGRS
jgi:hypothetical protein